jgi:integrase/recombinase XerD
MLNLYRRHQSPCRFTTRRYRNCKCPLWVQGSLRGEYIRRALNLRSWEAATDLIRGWEGAGEIGVVKKPDIPNIADAIARFLADARTQKLSAETIRKYENLLSRRLLPWCEEKGLRYLKQLRVEQMRQFRATWKDGANYATKNLERLRAFFRFCIQDDWIGKNPAQAVKAPKVQETPTLPFSRDEMTRILDACDRYPGNRDRIRAFVLVMRYSGLRIGDTIALSKARLHGTKLLLYTAKTGTLVYVPLPPVAIKALAKLETNDAGRYFSTGDAKPQTARANWSRYLDTVFDLADVPQGHSHRFRDTFAVELLLAGTLLETVSVLLGQPSAQSTFRAMRIAAGGGLIPFDLPLTPPLDLLHPPDSPLPTNPELVLGENDRAFVSYGNMVGGFVASSGGSAWSHTEASDITMLAAAADASMFAKTPAGDGTDTILHFQAGGGVATSTLGQGGIGHVAKNIWTTAALGGPFGTVQGEIVDWATTGWFQASPGGQRRSKGVYTDMQTAAFEMMDALRPLTTDFEHGGLICQNGPQFHWSRFVTSNLSDQVATLALASCLTTTTVAVVHTHRLTDGLDRPSGPDLTNADANQTLMYYLSAPRIDSSPGSQFIKYKGPKAATSYCYWFYNEWLRISDAAWAPCTLP